MSIIPLYNIFSEISIIYTYKSIILIYCLSFWAMGYFFLDYIGVKQMSKVSLYNYEGCSSSNSF